MSDKQQEILTVIEKYRKEVNPELPKDLVKALAEAFIVNSSRRDTLISLISDHVEENS